MAARYELKVVTEFASAHTLRDYPGACSRMHGHNWKVELEAVANRLDEVGMGGQMLQEAGFRRAWGIGRHILGSQIFDYWFGPDGRKFEHFADGDLFDASRPTRYHAMSAAGLAAWAPPVPAAFLRPRLGWHEIKQLLGNLFGRSSFGFKELKLLGAAFERLMLTPMFSRRSTSSHSARLTSSGSPSGSIQCGATTQSAPRASLTTEAASCALAGRATALPVSRETSMPRPLSVSSMYVLSTS